MTSNLKIEHYLLGKTLGVGAFGKVKLAKHEITGNHVAIKIINKKRMKTSKMNAKIKREIRLLRYFNHPNIIRLYDVLDTVTDIFVVMEYVSGGELFDLIAQKGRLPEAEARYYFKQIIDGVDYCHHNLVTHRDLKPENLLIDENKSVKIADFGLSNLMKDGKFLKTSCGSPNYAAPEVVSAKKYSGTEVDTWSCGVIVYALLAGYLPFDEEVIPKLFKKIRDAEYNMPFYFSEHAKDLIRRIFQVDPMKRIRFHELRFHPWLREAFPISINMLGHHRYENQNKINEEILQKLFKLEVDFNNLSEDKIREAIKKRKDHPFVIMYDIMNNEYNRKMINEGKKDQVTNNEMFIFSEIHKKLEQAFKDNPGYFYSYSSAQTQQNNDKSLQNEFTSQWSYGITYPLQPRTIMKGIYECLGTLDTAITVKSKEFRIKCFHKNPTKSTAFNNQVELENEDSADKQDDPNNPNVNPLSLEKKEQGGESKKKSSQKISKYSKKEVIFSIQIYAMPNKVDHLVDIQLNRGHPIMFLEFINQFINLLNRTLINKKAMVEEK